MIKKISILALILLLSACSATKAKIEKNPRPQWIDSPYIAGKITAVGSSHIHYKGKNAQRKLAISRAIDELAVQQGVHVSTYTTRHDKKSDGRYSAKSDIYSFQTSDNKTVHAHIKAVWSDPETDELFIWMVAD